MMKWMLSSIVVISCLSSSYSQNLEQTFQFAEQQLAEGWEARAEKAYKRVLFFDHENKYRGRCMEVLADLAIEKGETLEALNYLDQAYFLSRDSEQQNELQLRRIQLYIESGQTAQALAEIYQMDEEFDPKRLKLYEAYCHYWLKDFDEARQALVSMTSINDLDRFMKNARKIEKLNPKFYQTLSYIIPGLGQILLGDFKQSLNSLLLNVGLAALFIHTSMQLSFYDGAISIFPWFFRYYTGGAKLTSQLAIETKIARHKENFNWILDRINTQDQ